MTTKIIYISNDGNRFDDEAECLKSEAIMARVNKIMEPLPVVPLKDGQYFWALLVLRYNEIHANGYGVR